MVGLDCAFVDSIKAVGSPFTGHRCRARTRLVSQALARRSAAAGWGILKAHLSDSDIKMVIYGGQAMLGYYSDAPWILEGMAGLTDRELAQMPNRKQRVAHGAKATVPYLQERGLMSMLNFRIQQPMHPLNWIDFGEGVSGSIIRYQSEHMRVLKERGLDSSIFQNISTSTTILLNKIKNQHRTTPK